MRQGRTEDDRDEPDGFGPDHPVWAVSWLDGLRSVPDGASWPRLMTIPHPEAVGSYGPDLCRFVRDELGETPYWWQELAAARLLEHDADGELVWLLPIVSTQRRAGKSWLIRWLMQWRLRYGRDLWGERQEILHTSRSVSTTSEVYAPAQDWAQVAIDAAKRAGDPEPFRLNRGKGSEALHDLETGGQWLCRADKNAYGLGAHLAMCDEAWDTDPDVIAEGIEPTLIGRSSPQLYLVSTAHRKGTGLMLDRRRMALAELANPDARLIIEWSIDPEADCTDLEIVGAAYPRWDRGRRRLVAQALQTAIAAPKMPGEPDPVDMFAAQYGNRWAVANRRGRVGGEQFMHSADWSAIMRPGAGAGEVLTVAVEDYYGKAWAVAWVQQPQPGRLHVSSTIVEIDADADPHHDLTGLLGSLEARTMIVGASVFAEFAQVWNCTGAGGKELRTGLALVRRLAQSGRLTHNGDEALSDQATSVRVSERDGGLGVVRGMRSDVLRAAVWAVDAAYLEMSSDGGGVH